ncbi:hypothetical protein Tco_0570026 [Tanacetum coccineum]
MFSTIHNKPSVEVPSQKGYNRGMFEVPSTTAYTAQIFDSYTQEGLDKKAAGIGLVLWGDLKVLMDSPEVNDGSDVWKNQQTWKIQSWKLYSYSGVHVLETVSGLVVHMFVDKKYPLSVNLIERMLDHQLEICHGSVGNELTTAVQLIAFLKKQISDSRRPKVHDWYC